MNPERVCEVLIVGAGPAGMTAALWCAELGIDNVLLIDQRDEIGGQLCEIHNRVENYPGVQAANGLEVRDLFKRSLDAHNPETRLNTLVRKIDVWAKRIKFAEERSLKANAMIIATGVRRRKLGVDGEDEFEGRGIMRSGAGEKETVRGRRVVIVGGGDSALENALILSEFAREVTVVHRRASFSARNEFIDSVRGRDNVRFKLDTVVDQVVGNDAVEGVALRKVDAGVPHILNTDHVLIRIGVEPNSELLKGQVEMDERGYAIVDPGCRSSVPGVFVAGDLANPTSPTIATAVGMGASAAKSAYEFLKCSKN